jgi:hypothetical protein
MFVGLFVLFVLFWLLEALFESLILFEFAVLLAGGEESSPQAIAPRSISMNKFLIVLPSLGSSAKSYHRQQTTSRRMTSLVLVRYTWASAIH